MNDAYYFLKQPDTLGKAVPHGSKSVGLFFSVQFWTPPGASGSWSEPRSITSEEFEELKASKITLNEAMKLLGFVS